MNPPSTLAAIPPPVNAERTELTTERVRSAADVIAAFGVMKTADLERSRQRALCQAAVDGAAPYSDARGRAMGNWGRSNFNPGLARRSTFREQAPYNEVLEQMDVLFTVPTEFGDEDAQAVWEPIISEGLTAMLKRWPRFNYNWQYNVSLFVRDGVSIVAHEDENDWRPGVFSLQQFKFPNESVPCEDALDMCGWEKNYNCQALYQRIQNPKIAKKLGWNVEAVKAALKQAVVQQGVTGFDYEYWEKRWKANDVLDGARSPQVKCIHLLVREIDGTVTHLVSPSSADAPGNGKEGSPLFYEHRNTFRSMEKFLTIFAYGVGTNGDLHSIRGHTSNIYNAVVADTRAINAFVDGSVAAATPHLECASEDAMASIPMRKVGFMNLVQKGSQFLDTKMPPLEDNLIPLHGMLSTLLEGESSGGSAIPQRQMERKTNLQEMNESIADGQLTTSGMVLFFSALERQYKEMVRRIKRRNYRKDEPGGEEVWWLRNWLQKRGVPLDALYKLNVDALEVNTGVGKGSQRARMAAADSVMEDYYLLDDKGQNEALRLRLSTRVGSRKTNMLAPPTPGLRPGQQVDNADDQNGFLTGKNRAQILSVKYRPDQNSAAHVRTHLEFLRELWPMTQEQDQRNALDTLQPLWSHTVEDLRHVDPKNPLFKEAKQELREMSEWVVNTAKQLAAEEDRAQDEAARNGQSMNGNGAGKDVGGEGPDMSNLIRAVDARAKLQLTQDTAEFKRQMNAEDLAHAKEINSLDRAKRVQDMNLANVAATQKWLMQEQKPKSSSK